MNPKQKHIEEIGAKTITPTQAGAIMGMHRTTGWRRLQTLKVILKKPPDGFITVREFSIDTGLSIELCMLYIT